MRYPILALTLAALTTIACGGTEAPTGPPSSTPAAISIAAGNAQQAAPSAVVPNTVRVKVTDAGGNAVVGVTVAFRVDSGGGSIAKSSEQTGSDGTASPGNWTLGSAEGRNVLIATVGSLAPIKIVASAIKGIIALPPQTVGTGGGTIIVNAPGSDINGFKIEIPAGSFPVAQTVTISTAPSTSLVLPQGVTAAGPIITVRSSKGGYASHPLYITIPNPIPEGMVPAVLVIGANGPEELLPTFSYNSASMKVWTRHLDRELLASASGASFRNGDDTSVEMVQVYVPVATLYGKRDTEFKVGVDNWEFHPINTVAAPSISEGMITTEAYYYARVKRLQGDAPSLYKKYQESDGIEFSNRRGIRWSAVEAAYSSLTTDDGLKSVANTHGTDNPAELTKISFQNIRLYLRLFPTLPPVIQLLAYNGGQVQYQVDALVIATDRHEPTREIFLRTTVDPLNELVIPEPANGGPINVTLNGLPGTYTTFLAAGASQSIDFTTLKANYAKVEAGTIGDDKFPKYNLMSSWGVAPTDAAPVDKTLQYWLGTDSQKLIYAECTTCVGTTRPVQIPPGTAKVTGAAWYTTLGGTIWGAQNGGPVLVGKLDTPGTVKAAGELYAYDKNNQLAWLDYAVWNVKRAAAGILPLLPKATLNEDFALSLDIVNPPAGIEYFWDFGDNTTGLSATKNITHKWTTVGSKEVTATARLVTTKEPIAREKTTVDVQPQLAVWKFTSLTIAHEKSAGYEPFHEGASSGQQLYQNDSLRYTRARDGSREGGIYFADQRVTRVCTLCGTETFEEGLYLVDAATLNRTTLANPLWQTPILATLFGLPALPTIYAFPIARLAPDPNNPCKDGPGQFMTRTGTAVAGHITGSLTRNCQAGTPFKGFHRVSVDVTVNGDDMTGTIVVDYDVISFDAYYGTKTMRVNFVAKRVTQ